MSKRTHNITHSSLLEILNSSDLETLTNQVFCPSCDHPKIVDYENNIEVNDLFDVILKGKCSKCGKPVSRYIETGEHENSVKTIKKLLSKTA